MSDIVWGVHGPNGSEAEIFKRVSWGAIFSGVLVALAIEALFLLFGLYIGLKVSATAWNVGWTFVGAFVSLLVGAWVASRLTGNPNRGNGMLHGIVVWGLAMFTTLVLVTGLSWSVVKAGASFYEAAVTSPTATPVTPPSTTPATPAAPAPQQVATIATGTLSSISLVFWISLLIAAAGALIGGAAASPKQTDFTAHRLPGDEPVRPAA